MQIHYGQLFFLLHLWDKPAPSAWAGLGGLRVRVTRTGGGGVQRWVSSLVSVPNSCWFLVPRAGPTCESSGMWASGSDRIMYLQRRHQGSTFHFKIQIKPFRHSSIFTLHKFSLLNGFKYGGLRCHDNVDYFHCTLAFVFVRWGHVFSSFDYTDISVCHINPFI